LKTGYVGTLGTCECDNLIAGLAVSDAHFLEEHDFEVFGWVLGGIDESVDIEGRGGVAEPSVVCSLGFELSQLEEDVEADEDTCYDEEDISPGLVLYPYYTLVKQFRLRF
jgi:hypothetical protein